MASYYKRTGKGSASRFWWVKWRNPRTNTIERESTKFVIGRGDDLRKLLQLVAERTLAERKVASTGSRGRFSNWVKAFIETRYDNHNTIQRARLAWKMVGMFLNTIDIHSPEDVRREHCIDFVAWRIKLGHGNSPRAAKLNRNTAILDLKFFGVIMQEAVNRHFIQYNPVYRLGLKRTPPKEKGEITDEHAAIIRAEIVRRERKAETVEEKRNADFLRVSFEIAMAQGCRLSETYFDLRTVDFEAMELTLLAKGGKIYHPPINPNLVPLLRSLIKAGRTMTYDPPRMKSLVWFKVFDRLRKSYPELKDVSFHSSRVRVTSRLERDGAPEPVVMRLLNHRSKTVHRGYRRVGKQELEPFWSSLSPANGAVPKTSTPPSDTSPPAPQPSSAASDPHHKNPSG